MLVCSLRQSSAQAEDALSQGMEKLQQTLSESLLATADPFLIPDAYNMGTISAVEKLKGLVGFVQQVIHPSITTSQTQHHPLIDPWPEQHSSHSRCLQADHLRQETLQNMRKILTTRQAARGLLALGDYFQRLRALSTLWAARPRESALS
jgi:transcription factor TGA